MKGIVVDAGPLYALMDKEDDWHEATVEFLQNNQEPVIVPITVIPEVCYLVNKHLGPFVESRFIELCHTGDLVVESLVKLDFQRALDFMKNFSKANPGFVDASVAAVAERLRLNKILTTDRRHFALFRPRHCSHFTLLP